MAFIRAATRMKLTAGLAEGE
eukprot:COSAG04_NODE_18253_length_447_cov_1.037356_1_plen_20_part_10